MQDFNITRGVAEVERLKVALISELAKLYAAMGSRGGAGDCAEAIAGMILSCYLLSAKLGSPPEDIDRRAARLLRGDMFDGDVPDAGKAALLGYITKRQG